MSGQEVMERAERLRVPMLRRQDGSEHRFKAPSS